MKKKRESFSKRMMYLAMASLAMLVIMLIGTDPISGSLIATGLAVVPFFGTVELGTFKEITPTQFAELSKEDQDIYILEKGKDQVKQLDKLKEELKTNATAEIKSQILELKSSILDNVKALETAMKKQGEVLSKSLIKTVEDKPATLKDALEGSKDAIKAMIAGGKEVEIKAITNRASVTNNDEAYVLPDIGQLGHKKLTAYDVFPKLNVSSANDNGVVRYYDWDEATTVRAAAMIAESGTFPQSTAKWVGYTLPYKKIGDTMVVTEEMLEDSALFAAELGMFLDTNMQIERNEQVVNGDGIGENLTGLVASAPAWIVGAGHGLTDASEYDLIVKGKEQIQTLRGSKYSVDIAFMNIKDINNMKLKKDGNNNYIIPPFVSRDGKQVDGVLVLEENSITANTMVMGDRRFARIYNKAGLMMSKDTVGSQFIEDAITMKARERLLFLIRNVDKTGWLKVTSISAALTALES